jgi:flavin-dependent dehydrogenase
MLAAQAAFEAVQAGRSSDELAAYPEAFKSSWLHEEVNRARNFKQWMSKGLYLGTLMGRHRVKAPRRQRAVDAPSGLRLKAMVGQTMRTCNARTRRSALQPRPWGEEG